jgi:hypothetical protein
MRWLHGICRNSAFGGVPNSVRPAPRLTACMRAIRGTPEASLSNDLTVDAYQQFLGPTAPHQTAQELTYGFRHSVTASRFDA